MFIILTDEDNHKVRVNINSINLYYSYNRFSQVVTNLETLIVTETPEEIDELLKQSYITVKSIDKTPGTYTANPYIPPPNNEI